MARITSPADATKRVEQLNSDLKGLAAEMASQLADGTFDSSIIDLFEWTADIIEELQAVKNWIERYMHEE